MTTMQAHIKRHAVVAYFALAFAISWGGMLAIGGLGGLSDPEWQSDPRLPFLGLAMLAGPLVAGLLMTGLVDGRAGYRELLGRLLRWRVGARWYAVALLLAPLLTAATVLALSLISPVFLPAIITTDDTASLLLSALMLAPLIGILEELGWTGFAIPRLRLRHGMLATGLIVGVSWGAWHALAFWKSDSLSGALPLALVFVQLFAWLPAYRVLMVWVYDHTESLLVAMLMHASLVAGNAIILGTSATGAALVISILVWAAALWLVVAAVAVASGSRHARPARQLNAAWASSAWRRSSSAEGGATMRAVMQRSAPAQPGAVERHPLLLTTVLALGVVAPVLYVVIHEVIAALGYPGYDSFARPVSELTATYAPTRPILIPLLVVWELLMLAFWVGVWHAAPANRTLRLTSGLMLGFAVLGLLAFPFPMVADEVLGANTIYTIIWGAITPLLMLAGMGVSAAAFGKAFRLYAILTLVALVALSALAGVQAAQVNAGEPARWFGVTERALIGVWLQWVAVLAIALLRGRLTIVPRQPSWLLRLPRGAPR